MTIRKVLVCTLLCFILGATSWAIDLKEYIEQFQLSEKQIEKLNEKAREEYEMGAKFLDRVLFEFALQKYMKASEAQPDNKDLKFLIARLAIYEGRKEVGANAIALFEKARNAYNSLSQMDHLTRNEQEAVTQNTNTVNFLISSQAERDARRNKMTTKIIRYQVRVEKK